MIYLSSLFSNDGGLSGRIKCCNRQQKSCLSFSQPCKHAIVRASDGGDGFFSPTQLAHTPPLNIDASVTTSLQCPVALHLALCVNSRGTLVKQEPRLASAEDSITALW